MENFDDKLGHVTYSFINMLFISTENFDDKHRPQILLVGTTANSPLNFFTLYFYKVTSLKDTT